MTKGDSKWKHRSFRCKHGFANHGALCAVCRTPEPTSPYARNKYEVGSVYMGIKIVNRLGKDRIIALCPCGQSWSCGRTIFNRHRKLGTTPVCPKCTTKAKVGDYERW